MATVRAKGYAHWEGSLVERQFPWWPITRMGIQLTFRKKAFKFFFAGGYLPSFIALAGLYASERLEDFQALIRSDQALLNINPAYFRDYLTNGGLFFFLLFVLAFAGSGLIADDLKHNALQIYFARPLRKKDYLLGKASVVAFFVLVLTALPGLVLVIFKLIFSGSLKFLSDYPLLPFSIIGYSVLLTVFFAFYTMLLSSLSKNSRYVTILIFGMYLFSSVLHGILNGIFKTQAMALFSIYANIRQAGAWLFGTKLPYAFPAAWSFAVLSAVVALAAVVLARKIRSVEVIQ